MKKLKILAIALLAVMSIAILTSCEDFPTFTTKAIPPLKVEGYRAISDDPSFIMEFHARNNSKDPKSGSLFLDGETYQIRYKTSSFGDFRVYLIADNKNETPFIHYRSYKPPQLPATIDCFIYKDPPFLKEYRAITLRFEKIEE